MSEIGKFYVVMPESNSLANFSGKHYVTLEDAIQAASKMAGSQRSGYFVLEAIKRVAPLTPVVEVTPII